LVEPAPGTQEKKEARCNNMIPLITSLPPVISRQAKDGTEIGREYALECIRSWRSSGFYPVSVNAESEHASELIASEEIKLLTIERNSRHRFGKPLVYLDDFISAACSLTDGPVAVTNSDILIDIPEHTRQVIANLKPGQCVLSRRRDITDMNSREGEEYGFGYDFFAFHTRDFREFSSSEFVFGLPWWDHYFSIHLFLAGLRPVPVEKPFVFHLAHAERWERDNWIALGKQFLEVVLNESSGNSQNSMLASDYARRCERAVLGSDVSFVSRAGILLRGFTRRGKVENEVRMFDRVAAANMQWLDEIGSRHT
jgi:hypothetical protein